MIETLVSPVLLIFLVWSQEFCSDLLIFLVWSKKLCPDLLILLVRPPVEAFRIIWLWEL